MNSMKTLPPSPIRVTSLNHARRVGHSFFEHNTRHHVTPGIGLHTPADVHYGRADQIRAARQVVLDAAYTARPERFRRPPSAPQIPETTWINPPEETPLATQAV